MGACDGKVLRGLFVSGAGRFGAGEAAGGQSGVSAQILDSRTGIRDAARVYGGID